MPYADSASETVTLSLIGVWIGDTPPYALAEHNFPYGSAQREHSIDTMGAGSFYAGREHPVFDYGEHSDRPYGFVIDIPSGTTYISDIEVLEDFAQSRRPMWIRDNRGRVVHGTMSDLKITDTSWGATASFTVTQTHRDITMVVA